MEKTQQKIVFERVKSHFRNTDFSRDSTTYFEIFVPTRKDSISPKVSQKAITTEIRRLQARISCTEFLAPFFFTSHFSILAIFGRISTKNSHFQSTYFPKDSTNYARNRRSTHKVFFDLKLLQKPPNLNLNVPDPQ